MKSQDETKLQLKLDYEWEIKEVLPQIHTKFKSKLKETKANFQSKKEKLDAPSNEILMNKILVEAFKSR